MEPNEVPRGRMIITRSVSYQAGAIERLKKLQSLGLPPAVLLEKVQQTNYEVALDQFLTNDPSMIKLKHKARAINVSTANECSVLITGPSGTGKELIAKSLIRNDAPFVARNCAGLPKELIASLFFGHIRGTFTGADADRHGILVQAKDGIVFLDEIGDFPIELQATLLRAIQEREICRLGAVESIPIHCRFVAATKYDLRQRVEQGLFREDLFARLFTFELKVTGLKERPDDIYLIADQGFDTAGRRLNWPELARSYNLPLQFPPNALEDIYKFNVRAIQTIIHRVRAYGQYE